MLTMYQVWLFGRVEYEVVLLPFPHPTLATTDVIGTVGPFFFFGALMFNFVIQIGQIVTENEFKLRESMKVMGLRVSFIGSRSFFLPYLELLLSRERLTKFRTFRSGSPGS